MNAINVFFPGNKPVGEHHALGGFHSSIYDSGASLWKAFKYADPSNLKILCESLNVTLEFVRNLYNVYDVRICVPVMCLLIMGNTQAEIEEFIEQFKIDRS